MLLYLDSFDHYATADITQRWTQLYVHNTNPIAPVIGATGRRGTNGVRWSVNQVYDLPSIMAKTLAPADATCVMGCAFKHTGTFSRMAVDTAVNPFWNGYANALFCVRQGGAQQLAVMVNKNGTLSVVRGQSTIDIIGTTASALSDGVTYYVEFKTLIANAGGTIDIHVDGVSWLHVDTLDTCPTNIEAWDEVLIGWARLEYAAASVVWDFDDFYVADGSGADGWADFVGDIRVDALLPMTPAGTNTDFTASGGSDQWDTVDEPAANGDTDYRSSDTIGDKDTFNFPDAPVAGAPILGVQVVCQVKKEDAGSAGHKALARIGGTDYAGDQLAPPATYAFLRQCWGKQPSDGTSAWTDTVLNATEFGYTKSA